MCQSWDSQVVLVVKKLPVNAGDLKDTGLVPGLERSPGEEHGHPLQYSCLENPMDRGAWQATVHRIAESDTTERLRVHFSFPCIGEGNGNPLQCSCLENPRDREAWLGCHLWGRTESDMTEALSIYVSLNLSICPS